MHKLRSLPGIAAVGYLRQLAMTRPDGDFLAVGGPLDGAMFHQVNRLRIINGHAPRPDVPEEVVVPEPLAGQAHLRVGDSLPFKSSLPKQIATITSDADLPEPKGPAATLRVVGISRLPIDLSLQSRSGGVLILNGRSWRSTERGSGTSRGSGGAVRAPDRRRGRRGPVRRPAPAGDGQAELRLHPAALSVGGSGLDRCARHGILVFGAVAGLAGIIALGLIISRQVTLLSAGQSVVRDLGLSRRRRKGRDLRAAPHRGRVGALVTVLARGRSRRSCRSAFGARRSGSRPALRSADSRRRGVRNRAGARGDRNRRGVAHDASRWSAEKIRRRPSVVALPSGGGLASPATIGVGMALEPGRGRSAVPVRSSLVGAAVAVLGVAAVGVRREPRSPGRDPSRLRHQLELSRRRHEA